MPPPPEPLIKSEKQGHLKEAQEGCGKNASFVYF